MHTRITTPAHTNLGAKIVKKIDIRKCACIFS